jgi:hypothetical protein
MRGDGRSRRVAVVSDRIVNPPDGDRTAMATLAEAGWGLVQLPPPGLEPADRAEAIAAVVDQLAAFVAEDYEVALAVDSRERGELIDAAGVLRDRLAAAPSPSLNRS